MKRFWDKLVESRLSLAEEIYAIEMILDSDCGYGITLQNQLHENFLSWEHRQNNINLESMLEKTGITDIIDMSVENVVKGKSYEITVASYLDYADYVLNILVLTEMTRWPGDTYIKANRHRQVIMHNIENTLSNLGHEVKTMAGSNVMVTVPKNASALNVATKVPNLADDILRYIHRDSDGNLKVKSEILTNIYRTYEAKWNNALKNQNHSRLASDIRHVANKFIRHDPKCKESQFYATLDDKAKEKYYDCLFDLFMSAYHITESKKAQDEIASVIQTALKSSQRADDK